VTGCVVYRRGWGRTGALLPAAQARGPGTRAFLRLKVFSLCEVPQAPGSSALECAVLAGRRVLRQSLPLGVVCSCAWRMSCTAAIAPGCKGGSRTEKARSHVWNHLEHGLPNRLIQRHAHKTLCCADLVYIRNAPGRRPTGRAASALRPRADGWTGRQGRGAAATGATALASCSRGRRTVADSHHAAVSSVGTCKSHATALSAVSSAHAEGRPLMPRHPHGRHALGQCAWPAACDYASLHPHVARTCMQARHDGTPAMQMQHVERSSTHVASCVSTGPACFM
jgi:hypothetical protein